MAKQNKPIGFKPMPREAEEPFLRSRRRDDDDDLDDEDDDQEEEKPSRMPLVEPIFVDDVELTEILKAYNLFPLAPISKFEYQLVQVIAALEEEVKKWR